MVNMSLYGGTRKNEGRKIKNRTFYIFEIADLELDEGPSRPHFKGVEKVKITEAFKTVGDRMLFFFDYGDNWEFSIELKEIRDGENQGMKTAVIESTGTAPIQYPPCER